MTLEAFTEKLDEPSSTKLSPTIRREFTSRYRFTSNASTCLPGLADGVEDLCLDEVDSNHGDGAEDDDARWTLPMNAWTTTDETDTSRNCPYDQLCGELDEDAWHDRLLRLGNPGCSSDVQRARTEGFSGVVPGRSGHLGPPRREGAFEVPKDIWRKQGKCLKLFRIFGDGSAVTSLSAAASSGSSQSSAPPPPDASISSLASSLKALITFRRRRLNGKSSRTQCWT